MNKLNKSKHLNKGYPCECSLSTDNKKKMAKQYLKFRKKKGLTYSYESFRYYNGDEFIVIKAISAKEAKPKPSIWKILGIEEAHT